MYQIKSICAKPEKLESEFNKFFEEHPNIEVVQMKQSQSANLNYVALTILYKIK